MDRIFLDLAIKLRVAASHFPPNSLQHRLTLNPPDVIKDVLILSGYLEIDPMSKMIWIPMAALCCDINTSYYQYKKHYILSGVSDQFYDDNPIDNFMRVPFDFVINKQTHELFQYNPADLDFINLF